MSVIAAMLLAMSQLALAKLAIAAGSTADTTLRTLSDSPHLGDWHHHVLSLDIPDEGEGSAADPFRHLYDRFTPFEDEIFGDLFALARGAFKATRSPCT